jgi:hypothetical protein
MRAGRGNFAYMDVGKKYKQDTKTLPAYLPTLIVHYE